MKFERQHKNISILNVKDQLYKSRKVGSLSMLEPNI